MAAKIFIDGEVGTTGLQIKARLEGRNDIELLHLAESDRKNPDRKREILNESDLAILCLPDDAAREAVALIDNPETRVIDPSTAHRTADGWVYGFPEYDAGQRDLIANSKRVPNRSRRRSESTTKTPSYSREAAGTTTSARRKWTRYAK